MSWISKYFAGIQQADFYKSQLADAVKQKADAESALWNEIDRNRRREAVLTLKILELANASPNLTPHADLSKSDEKSIAEISDISDDDTGSFKEDVRIRAQEFIEIAEERGLPYTPEQIKTLYAKITEDPERYLS